LGSLVRPFIIPKYIVDVPFNLFIDNIEFVDNEFNKKSLLIKLDVSFKNLI
jgi:hypothetical protein